MSQPSSAPPVIRRAAPNDRQAICEIQRAAILETCRRSYPEEDVTVWAGLLSPDSYHSIQDRYFVVAERGGRIDGFGMLDEAEGEVEAIYVSPSASGEGIGSAILLHLEDRARQSGLQQLKVRSTLNAESFYARHGYQHLALIRYRLVPSLMLNCVEMRKLL